MNAAAAAIRQLTAAAALSLLAVHSATAGLVVSPSSDAAALANLLAGGGGVQITSVTLVGVEGQQGIFSGGLSAGIGIDRGVLLTSGLATLAPGPNNDGAATGEWLTPGDAQLDGLVPGSTTYDANVLAISFTTSTGNLFFNYVFASEEYNEYVNSRYNDVFGFFLNGTNIALVPGTSTPVAINSINCGKPYAGAGPNCNLFNNNDLSSGGPYFDLQYDGFTKVFTAAATGLDPEQVYTIKLAIADTDDSLLDSAVFLQANSFSGQPTSIPEPGSLALVGAAWFGIVLVGRRRRG